MILHIHILISFLLQTILVLFGPLRKRTRNGVLLSMISSAQLYVDRGASLILAIISASRQQDQCREFWYYRYWEKQQHQAVMALWVPFLLLHLGGSDIITVSPLEGNNALWLRYIFVVLNQVLVSRIVILSYSHNSFRVATILLFVAGTIKYGERTRALYLTNRNRFRESLLKEPDPGPNYAKIMEEYTSLKEAHLPIQIKLAPEINEVSNVACYAKNEDELDDLAVVNHAFHFFEIFKGLIVDHIFSFNEREHSREFFLKRKSGDAFRVLATELNFIYGILYTKVVVYSGFGFVLRIISSWAVIAAFFVFQTEISYVTVGDAIVTYILFCGAIGLDAVALFMFACSDWTLAHMLRFSRDRNWKAVIARCFLVIQRYFLTLKRTNWRTVTNTECQKSGGVLFRRWSESLQTYNLIDYCLKDLPWTKFTIIGHFGRNLIEGLDLKNIYNSIKYITEKPIPKEVWDSIFNELKANSTPTDDVDITKRKGSTRGEWILQHSNWHIDYDQSIYCKLMPYIDYDQSIIIWHIATDLCYTIDELKNSDPIRREICKILSDYMLYLLIMHPTMMLTVAGIAHIIFRDTCAEAKNFFSSKKSGEKKQEKEHEWACQTILSVITNVEPINIKGGRSKSVLFDACILAKELQSLEGQKRWKLMNEVWVELLSYAASHCKATIHVAQLGKGGEFLTFVWLLMAHFGLGDHFERKQGQPRAKLIVGK